VLFRSLDSFIQKFVLCSDCKNPETDLVIKGKGEIRKDCKACGSSTAVDMKHKLCTYIIKNPPTSSHTDKYNKRIKKNQKESEASGISTPADTSDNEVDDLTRRIQAEAQHLKDVKLSQFEEDDWAEDMSPEAVLARQNELASGAVRKMTGSEREPVEIFADWVVDEGAGLPNFEIRAKADQCGVRDEKAAAVLVQTLFTADMDAASVEERAGLLMLFMSDEKAQKGLLGGFERFVGETHKDLLPQVPMLLKAFYDNDLVEEDVFIQWSQKLSKRYVDKKVGKEVRARAAPFIKWLEEADESEEDSD